MESKWGQKGTKNFVVTWMRNDKLSANIWIENPQKVSGLLAVMCKNLKYCNYEK